MTSLWSREWRLYESADGLRRVVYRLEDIPIPIPTSASNFRMVCMLLFSREACNLLSRNSYDKILFSCNLFHKFTKFQECLWPYFLHLCFSFLSRDAVSAVQQGLGDKFLGKGLSTYAASNSGVTQSRNKFCLEREVWSNPTNTTTGGQ